VGRAKREKSQKPNTIYSCSGGCDKIPVNEFGEIGPNRDSGADRRSKTDGFDGGLPTHFKIRNK
jgi:hypothetical protein